jgi:hypothetical protein
VRVEDWGRIAEESFEVMATEPEYPVAVLPFESLAVTVKEKAEPEAAWVGILLKAREATGPGTTDTAEVPRTALPPSVDPRVTAPAVKPVKEAL